MYIKNISRVDWKYRYDDQHPIITNTYYSNVVSTLILDNRIKLTKYTLCKQACVFEEITYVFYIQNVSTLTINNLFFQDILTSCTRFIHNSVVINGKKVRCISPITGFYLDPLCPDEIITVCFSVVVSSYPRNSTIQNTAQVCYDYVYDMFTPPTLATQCSNTVTITIKDKLFKQISHQIVLPTSIDFTNLVITPTAIKGKMIKNCYGTYILVTGILSYENFGCFIHSEGFSCLLAVPDSASYCSVNNIKAVIKNIVSLPIDDACYLINMQLFIHIA